MSIQELMSQIGYDKWRTTPWGKDYIKDTDKSRHIIRVNEQERVVSVIRGNVRTGMMSSQPNFEELKVVIKIMEEWGK